MKRLLVTTTAILMAAKLTGCAVTEVAPFDPRAMQRSAREGARGASAADMRPLPTTRVSPFGENNGRPTTRPSIEDAGRGLGSDPIIRMTLSEIMHRVIANNGEIRVAAYTPAIDQTRVIEADSRFDLTFFSNLQAEKRASSNVITTAGEGAQVYTLESGLRQNLITGAQAQLSYRTSITQSRGQGQFGGNAIPSQYQNELSLQITQPLLRDFGTGVNRARININRNNQHISVLEFRRRVEETMRDVERLYWQLVQAERELKIQERLLQRTIDTGFVIAVRGLNDAGRVQVAQADSSIQQRRAELISIRARIRDLSDQIKRQMQDPDISISGPLVVMAAEPPVEQRVNFKVEELVASAMENRFELGQQFLRVDNADVAREVARNNLLPQLNLQIQGGLTGLDPQWINAAANQMDIENWNLSAALQFEIPIGNRGARAIFQRAMLQRLQAQEQYRSIVAQIEQDVRIAAREVETRWNEIGARRSQRFAADEALRANQAREDGGVPLTPEFVQLKLNLQSDLADAERREAEALSNYNIAIANLELAQGTLLRYNNVVLEEEEIPFIKTLISARK